MKSAVKYSSQNIENLRVLIKEKLVFSSQEHDGDYHMNPDYKSWVISNAVKDAAVLIGLVEREGEAHVLLTKRAEQLNSHSGQVAFPGGKIDEDDVSPEAAALREAQEEIGLDQDEVEVIGRLPDYYSGSGFKIAPILAIVSSSADFEINKQEVDYLFEVPLSFLMNTDNHTTASRMFQDNERFYLEMPYKEHFIWGVTAGIIRVLHDRVFAQ